MTDAAPKRWLLLIHSLPTRPLYLRARVRRELERAGAAPLKRSVYVRPWSAPGLEDLRSIAAGIRAAGASAFVCEATFDDAESQRAAVAAMRTLRGAAVWAGRKRDLSELVGLRWVTRRGVLVDRVACAWVVRRFIDPDARFRFVAAHEATVSRGEIGFDMEGAAVTHEHGGCSVETLLRRARLDDPALSRISEIVHDLDLRDGKFRHPETEGFERLLLGTIAALPGDDERLDRGLPLFDALYASLTRGPAVAAKVPRAPRRSRRP